MPSRREMLALAMLWPATTRAAQTPSLRVGILPFGTVSWEVETIRRLGLDAANGLTLEPVKLAGSEAARIAFQGGGVDLIVSDLLWAARLRNEGRRVRFLPFSSTEGALMVPPGSSLARLDDLAGKRIGVAGGALDKTWLLLQANARAATRLDLAADASPVYGSPPLLTQQLEAGKLDAALLYWTFCARLEAKGFRRLLDADAMARAFGVAGPVALLGYVLDESVATRAPGLVDGFARASAAAKAVLAGDDSAWTTIRPLMGADDEATYATLRRAFLAGIPRRPVAAERADAERLYALLAELGGERLVGSGTRLPEHLYWGEETSG